MSTKNNRRYAVPLALTLTFFILLIPTIPSKAQSTTTISGTIRHNGSPISGVSVQGIWAGGDRELVTGNDGRYRLTGVPTKTWLTIYVRPPIGQLLAFRNWGGDVTRNLVKDFDLQSGYRWSGKFLKPDGTPFLQRFWLPLNSLEVRLPEGEWFGDRADAEGHFDLVSPPGFYTLFSSAEVLPYFMPTTRIDLRGGSVTSTVVTLRSKPELLPTAPPIADLIRVGTPDTEGYATIDGARGSVVPWSAVFVANLSAEIYATTIADAGGAFTATLFAPSGSFLLVKYDPSGESVYPLMTEAAKGLIPGGDSLNELPGTIIYAGKPLPRGDKWQDFDLVRGVVDEDYKIKKWAGWQLSGRLEIQNRRTDRGLIVQRGQQVTVSARLRVTSPAFNCSEGLPPKLTLTFNQALQYAFGADGHARPWGTWFSAHLFTPTGLPIDRQAFGQAWGVGSGDFTAPTCISKHTLEASLNMSFGIPDTLPDGIYFPFLTVTLGDMPLDPNTQQVAVWYHFPSIPAMPALNLGSVATPRIPWALLGDYPVNGHRGVQAREDVGYFAMPTRVVFPPHQVILPRLDERTGAPLAYRLEPGSQWLSGTDRRQPNPPFIPLALPSGELTVRVLKPDGKTDTLGPAPIRQSSVRTPTTPGGAVLDDGTGQVADLYHLSTMNDSFAYRFKQYGLPTITLSGQVLDVYGTSYPVTGTYDVYLARQLDLDPGQLPTTPYMQGDAFAPGVHIFPPVPADVTVRLVQMPNSDPDPRRSTTRTVTGRANRFGYFQPPVRTEIRLGAPGEFRADISATYQDKDGTLWMGAMTWGNVVEGPRARIEAHGRRTMDPLLPSRQMPTWYEVVNLPTELKGVEVDYPYFSGDVHWGIEDGQPGDSIQSIINFKDRTSNHMFYDKIRARADQFLEGDLETRIAVGEAPLLTTAPNGIDPAVDPGNVDLWGYWYAGSERADVHVREVVGTPLLATAYWRFNDTYGYQIGEGAMGDLPGDLKWEFGGAVFRERSQSIYEYAIYSSLWVLLPHGDAVGARIAPPFQDATGAGINGGPIMTLKGKEIDMLFLPKGVRPGDVLEVGDVVAFSGHVGPPLDSQVSITITTPSGATRKRTWQANKIGWVYDPSFDFAADEAGRWTVDVSVLHNRPYIGNGVIPKSHNTGTVLGTSGRYEFYVVSKESPRLELTSPKPGFLSWPSGKVEPVYIRGVVPLPPVVSPGPSVVYYTIHDKGVVMAQGSVVPDAGGNFTIPYDARALNADFPFLDLTAHEGRWEGLADEVAINLLAVGRGQIVKSTWVQANTVTLISEEVFIGTAQVKK